MASRARSRRRFRSSTSRLTVQRYAIGASPSVSESSGSLERLQEDGRAEADVAVELAEWAIGHEVVDPRVELEASGEQMLDRDGVDRRHLEVEMGDVERRGTCLHVKQDLGQIRGIERGDRPGAVAADDGQADAAIPASIDVSRARREQPTHLRLIAGEPEDRALDLGRRVTIGDVDADRLQVA